MWEYYGGGVETGGNVGGCDCDGVCDGCAVGGCEEMGG